MAKKVVTFGELLMRLSPEEHKRFIQADSFGVVYGGAECCAGRGCVRAARNACAGRGCGPYDVKMHGCAGSFMFDSPASVMYNILDAVVKFSTVFKS